MLKLVQQTSINNNIMKAPLILQSILRCQFHDTGIYYNTISVTRKWFNYYSFF